MGVGTIGENLWDYEGSDTFLSTDGGLNGRMVHKGTHKYEFGDLGSILVIVDNEEHTDTIRYSLDLGSSWYVFRLSFSSISDDELLGKHIKLASSSARVVSSLFQARARKNSSSWAKFLNMIKRRTSGKLSLSTSISQKPEGGSAAMAISRSGTTQFSV